MQSDRDLLKQALHTLEGWANHREWVWPESALEQAKRNTTEAITALRERLEQPEFDSALQSAAMTQTAPKLAQPEQSPLDRMAENARELGLDYEPVQEPLTEKRIEELYSFWVVDCQDIVAFARAIERHKAKPQMQPCAGRNCGSTNPNLHSAECFEDYEKTTGMVSQEPKCAVIVEVFGKEWRLDYMALPVGKHKLYTQQYTYAAPSQRKPLPPQSPCEMTQAENKMFKLGWLECEAAHGIKGEA